MRDSETGVDFFNARYFTGALGRFNNPDPMNAGGDVTDPQTWNGYGYVRNEPMGLVDRSGLAACLFRQAAMAPHIAGPGACRGVYEGGDGGVSIDGGAAVPVGLFGDGGGLWGPGFGGGESAVQCPNNLCTIGGTDPLTGQPAILQFYAGAGGATGYLSGYDVSQGLNEVNGTFMSDAQYNAWIRATFAGDISKQRALLAQAIAGNSGGAISYQDAYNALDPAYGHLQGGNYNFVTSITPGSLPACNGDPRCNGVHFPGQAPDGSWYVHLDSSNPWASPAALLQHFFVDVFLGNIAYYVIPR